MSLVVSGASFDFGRSAEGLVVEEQASGVAASWRRGNLLEALRFRSHGKMVQRCVERELCRLRLRPSSVDSSCAVGCLSALHWPCDSLLRRSAD